MKIGNNRLLAVAFVVLSVWMTAMGLGTSALAAGSESGASDPMQFARGAKSWADVCAGCHNMRAPDELRDDQWRAVVTHMRVRSGISGGEARDILAFLQGSN